MQTIISAVERHRTLILDAERYIWAHPETGYREVETTKYMEDAFTALGYDITRADGITGFYTVIDTHREGPEVLVLGELDSIICPTHPEANKVTGAVHSCGHNTQCAALLGVAAALRDPEVLARLCGRIRLCAVPAEELLEIEYRKRLRDEGKIKYFGGKTEFLSRGYFDGVDMAFMVHASTKSAVTGGSVGCVAKNITYKGVAAHAGGAPWAGRNALYAATCGLNAVNAIRETFAEPDIIRVHPIITHGGDMVNAIPAKVTLESYVRGSSFDAIVKANKSVNRALIGAALSLGNNIDITDIPGYAPLHCDSGLMNISEEIFRTLFPDKELIVSSSIGSGSTDMGDLSQIMPTVHLYISGQSGTSHGSDYRIADPESACVDSAKWQTALLTGLLKNGGERAKRILADYTPAFASKEEYFSYLDSFNVSGDRIVYGDGTANVKL